MSSNRNLSSSPPLKYLTDLTVDKCPVKKRIICCCPQIFENTFMCHVIDNKLSMAAVLKLEVATLFRVAEYFLRVAKSLPGLLSGHFTFRYVVACSILGSQSSENNLKRVAIQKVWEPLLYGVNWLQNTFFLQPSPVFANLNKSRHQNKFQFNDLYIFEDYWLVKQLSNFGSSATISLIEMRFFFKPIRLFLKEQMINF
jgi:hypothetical protein